MVLKLKRRAPKEAGMDDTEDDGLSNMDTE